MNDPKYVVGIDLGTSNCALAFASLAEGQGGGVTDFAIAQLQRAGEISSRSLLPSCIYLPGEHELAPEATRLPWGDCSSIAGEFARWQGARVPGRLIASAKSWLCHPGVDRSASILPWGGSSEVHKLSPVDASALLLSHLAQAWNSGHLDAPLAAQAVIITVPASFDEMARALTVNAARQAGLEKFTLVEEPQAAFYDFISRNRQHLDKTLQGVGLVLVLDVGGGTTDFTLVQVATSPEGPLFRRIAVGDHLMLGGDNMDAALSRKAEERMLSGGRKLTATQWTQLLQAAREAKESLLSEGAPDQYNLSLVAEGSRLVGKTLSTYLSRSEAEQIVLDGFFPACAPDETPRKGARVAIQELGLPYAQEPAITRHLAAFLRQHAQAGFAVIDQAPETQGSLSNLPRPDAILLNGGVFNSAKIAARFIEAVSAWWPSAPSIQVLQHDSLDLAVARGAAYYGLVRRGLGRRIGGGAAHAFYVGLEQAGTEITKALCVIPRGHEEGETVELGGRVFHLTLGRPVQFPLFSTTSDRVDTPGALVPVSDEMHVLPPIHTLLKGAGGKTGNVPVHLRATLTEIGTLELWCVAEHTGERWRLEFELRGAPAQGPASITESMPPHFEEAREWVERIFGNRPMAARHVTTELRGTPPKDVRQLWGSLEKTLGSREDWRVPVLRELWGALFAGAAKRRRSADHERIFFQLAGYSLRPGFGYPLDEWRCDQMFPLFAESVQFHKEKIVWIEFWIMWRRIAGGLSAARHHQEIWNFLKPHLIYRLSPTNRRHSLKPKGMQPEGLDEMVRLAAALEHLAPEEKAELGHWITTRLREPSTAGGPWAWALGRLGARMPIYGSIHNTVAPRIATEWVSLLLDQDFSKVDNALFAVAQLARLTGDRARDLDGAIRARAIAALQGANASPSWLRMLTEVVALELADRARALGDTLPVGLQLA